MNIDLQGLLAAAKTFPQFGYTGLFILLIAFLMIRSIILTIEMWFVRKSIERQVTLANAMRAYKLLKKKLGVSMVNHPKTWATYRNMFYKINQSDEVPSELKEKLKQRLIKKGLYINNMRIIDNYKGR